MKYMSMPPRPTDRATLLAGLVQPLCPLFFCLGQELFACPETLVLTMVEIWGIVEDFA